MAHIRKRTGPKGTAWQAVVKVEGRTVRRTFDRHSKATAWARQTEESLERGDPLGERTVAEAIDRYIVGELVRKAASTQRTQLAQLKAWRADIGHLRLSQLSASLFVGFRDELAASGKSPATVNRYLAVLSHVLSRAAGEWQWMDRQPLRGVSRLREPPGRVRFLDRAEIEALLEACRGSSATYLYPIVILALTTGMRRGEILGLKWGDIDSGRAVIRLEETKNRERRTVPLAPDAAEALRAMPRRIDSQLLFPGQGRAGRERPIDPRDPWEEALAAAKIKGFRFHDLRHTAASYLAMGGATEREIAEVLGHKTLAMVKRYSHLSSDHLRGVQDRLLAGMGLSGSAGGPAAPEPPSG